MENIVKEAQHEISNFFHNLFVNGLTKKIEETPEKVKSHVFPDLESAVQTIVGNLMVDPLDKITRRLDEVSENISETTNKVHKLGENIQKYHQGFVTKYDDFGGIVKSGVEEARLLKESIGSLKAEMTLEINSVRKEISRVESSLQSFQESMSHISKVIEESEQREKSRFLCVMGSLSLICCLVVGFSLLR